MNIDLAGKRMLVTGGRGFIGTHLVARLRDLGAETIFPNGDVRETREAGHLDVVFHFAAALPAAFHDDPEPAFSVNVLGTLRMLELCRQTGARLVFPSTCGVYAPNLEGALSEESPVRPPSAYAMSKAAAEVLCESYDRDFGVASRVIRLFNVYGPGQKPPFLVPYLVKCAASGEPPAIRNPESRRDFIHVNDVVEGALQAAVTDAGTRVYNLGSGIAASVLEVIASIDEAREIKMDWTHDPQDADPMPIAYADNRLAADQLGWCPRISLSEGIADLIAGDNRVFSSRG